MDITDKMIWIAALVLVFATMVMATRPLAHCHDSTCHAHPAGR